MKKIKESIERLKSWGRKLFTIDDTPQKIALGAGTGVFMGMFPGTGPIAAVILAALFHANKAAALLGAVLTNTWFSLIALTFSAKVGSLVLGSDWHEILNCWQATFRPFTWHNLLKTEFLKILLPVALGYLIISLIFALLVYIIVFFVCRASRSPKKSPV